MEVGFGAAEFILSEPNSEQTSTWVMSSFCLSDLNPSSSQRAIEELGTPQRGKVLRKEGAPLEKGLPEYLVEPVEYAAKNRRFLDEVQLVDLGECMDPCSWLASMIDLRQDWSSILYS